MYVTLTVCHCCVPLSVDKARDCFAGGAIYECVSGLARESDDSSKRPERRIRAVVAKSQCHRTNHRLKIKVCI